MDNLTYRLTKMVLLFYTTYISVDLAHHKIFHAKAGKGGINGTAHKNLMLIAPVQKLLNVHARTPSGFGGLNCGIRLLLLAYIVYVRSKGSGKAARRSRLVRTITAHRCDNYQNLLCWPR